MLRLQLQWISGWPDGQHRLRREAAADFGKSEIKSQTAGENLERNLVGAVDDLLQVLDCVCRVVECVHQGLEAGKESVSGFFDAILDKGTALLPFHDDVDDCGHAVEDRLANSRWLACDKLVFWV